LQEKNEGLDKLIKKYEEEKSGKTFEIDRITEEKKNPGGRVCGYYRSDNRNKQKYIAASGGIQ